MTTAETPGCTTCPLVGEHPFTPDTAKQPAMLLLDRPGDAVPPSRLLKSFGTAHALRCPVKATGKKMEKALVACRVHDDWTGVNLVVVPGPVGWKALGLADWGLNRGYAREVR